MKSRDYRPQKESRRKGPSLGGRLLRSLLKKILLSPSIAFIIGFFYFNQDLRKGALTALYFYTCLTLLLVISKAFGILTSFATFRLFKVVSKSIGLAVMVVMLLVYWLIYSLYFHANFTLF